MTDLEAGLLSKDDQNPFGITCETLKEFMSLDGIKDYKSVENLIKIKGVDGLASRLKVNLKVIRIEANSNILFFSFLELCIFEIFRIFKDFGK